MTDTDELERAVAKIEKYLAERAKAGQLDPIDIHALHMGDAREAVLTTANLRLILSANRKMREALEELTDVFAHEGECSTGRFDRLAEMFYRDTRMMAPGKDRGMGGPDQPDGAELRAIYDAWFAAKVTRARSALTTQRGQNIPANGDSQ